MEIHVSRSALTDDEVDCLRTAPHSISPYTNVYPGTPGGIVHGLYRLGYLEAAKHVRGRDVFGDYTVYDLTRDGLAAIGGQRPTAAENELIGVRWPPAERIAFSAPSGEWGDTTAKTLNLRWPWLARVVVRALGWLRR